MFDCKEKFEILYGLEKGRNLSNFEKCKFVLQSLGANVSKIKTFSDIFTVSCTTFQYPYLEKDFVNKDVFQNNLLDFLLSEVQLEKVERLHSRTDNTNFSLFFQKLHSIGYPIKTNDEMDDTKKLNTVIAAIEYLLSRSSNGIKLFSNEEEQILIKNRLLLEKVHGQIFEDLTMRKHALLCRLDVTLQSFLSSAVNDNEGNVEIMETLKPIRAALSQDVKERERKARLTKENGLIPFSLVYSSKEIFDTVMESTNSRKSSSALKGILMGNIGDRGGRPNEMRPSLGNQWGRSGGKKKKKNKKYRQ